MISEDYPKLSKNLHPTVEALGNESTLSFRTCRARAGSEWWLLLGWCNEAGKSQGVNVAM